jgi:hypothetical protein
MSLHFKLTDAVLNTANDVDMHNRWIPDKDWVRSFWNQPGFSRVTPGCQLNKAIAVTLAFLNNKYKDPKSGRTIFHNTRKVVTSAKEKTKKKIYLYYVSSDDRKERPEFSSKSEF